MKKIISLIISICCILTILAYSNSQSSSTTSSSQETPTVTMSDDLKDLTFTLDGVVYQFPCTYQTFIDNGWVNCTHEVYTVNHWLDVEDFDPESTVKAQQEIWKLQYLKKENDVINISSFYNNSSEIKPLSQCFILNIGFDERSMDSSHIVFAKGIDLNSTLNDLRKAYGNPDEDDYFFTYYLTEGDMDGDHRNRIQFDLQDESVAKDGDSDFANQICIVCDAKQMK